MVSLHQFTQQIQLVKQYYARGEHASAVRICDQLEASLGQRDDLLNIKAMSLLALGQLEAAESTIRLALKVNPRIAGMHLNAASIYKSLSLNKKVKRHVLEAMRLAPKEARVLYQAALLLRDGGDYSQALRVIDRCVQLQPGFSHGWYLKGSMLVDLGETEAAQRALEMSVELEPGNVRALSTLVSVRGDNMTDVETVERLRHIQSSGASPVDRASAMFTLAGMHRRDSQHGAAFELYLKANAKVSIVQPFDPDAWEEKVADDLRASAVQGALAKSSGSSGDQLVFIIGMPRSGTTLCEQVLSAHSGVLACGELATMAQIENGFRRRGIDPYQNDLAGKEIEQAASLYLSVLPKGHHKFQIVTDKAPMNFERVGLIHRLFPKARFIYCTRHPLDTILSCFMQDFQAGLFFASNLEHITRVYIAHTQLMRHWMSLLPEQIHMVSYEKYIAKQESESRQMADFLNLEFEQDILNPHLRERAVTTASNLQVRQAVYASSIGRWKNYLPQLSEVVGLLQQAQLLDTELNEEKWWAQ
jgi:tetratricopeptide (TPR) repeat protein